jgi:GDP-D-mannose dehydratase
MYLMLQHEQPDGWVSPTRESENHHALSEILATVIDSRLNWQEHIAIDASLNRLREIAVI